MSERITPEEFRKVFLRAYHQLSFNVFVENILHAVPNYNDVWQEEKFFLFQRAAESLGRLSLEMTNDIISYSLRFEESKT